MVFSDVILQEKFNCGCIGQPGLMSRGCRTINIQLYCILTCFCSALVTLIEIFSIKVIRVL